MTDYSTSLLGFGDDSPRSSYTLRVNGLDRPVADAWIGESLLYVLRERLGLAGAKSGCEQGECGACSVQVDGQLTAACLVPAALAAGVEIRTVEGLAEEGVPSDVQQALADSGAVQCGFCAPGLAMAVHDLLERNHHPSELESRQALCGNLCRCTGYRGALAAVHACATARAEAAEGDASDASHDAEFGVFGAAAGEPVDGLAGEPAPLPIPVPSAPSAAEMDHPVESPYAAEFAEGQYADPAEYGEYGEGEYAGYGEAGYGDAGYGDADGDAELPVYVDVDLQADVQADVPPQHGGYEQGAYQGSGYDGYGGAYPDGGYGGGYGNGGYGDGGHGGDGGHPGQGPHPEGPFEAPFPGQADGPGSRSAAGSLRVRGAATASAAEADGPAESGARRMGSGLGAGLMAQGIAERRRAAGPGADAPQDTGAFGAFAGLNPDSTGAFRIDVQRGEPVTVAEVGGAVTAVAVDAPSATATASVTAVGATATATHPEPYEAHPTGQFATGQFETGQFETGQFAVGQFHTGQFDASQFRTGPFETGQFATGHFETGHFETGQFEADEFETGHFETGGFSADEFGQGGAGTPDPSTGVYVLPHQHGQETGS